MNYQNELLQDAKKRYSLPKEICDAYEAMPRHEFLSKFSPDYISWLKPTPENYVYIYTDSTLLLYERQGFVSTISQPSFVLKMLQMLDLRPGMRVFELGAGSGWNAAMMGYLVGKKGKVTSYEIIPEMTKQAKDHLAKFDLPQVEVVQGDALSELWEKEEFDRGIFTAGAWDMPGILFDVIKEGGKLLFVLKTSSGDLLMAMKRMKDHFKVYETMACHFVPVTGKTLNVYHNDLSEIYRTSGEITIWPQGTLGLGQHVMVGRDMIFKIE